MADSLNTAIKDAIRGRGQSSIFFAVKTFLGKEMWTFIDALENNRG